MFNKHNIILGGGIRIIARDSFLDVVLLEKHKELSKIMLSKNEGVMLSDEKADINFDDIIGIRGKGYGIIVMNSTIDYLKENHNPDLIISGIISDVDDLNLEKNLQNQLKKKRREFFRKFNFRVQIREPNNFDRIYASIKDLKNHST